MLVSDQKVSDQHQALSVIAKRDANKSTLQVSNQRRTFHLGHDAYANRICEHYTHNKHIGAG
jgi:hypothetical protein